MTPPEFGWHVINAAALPVVFLGSTTVAYPVAPAAGELCWVSLFVVFPLLDQLETAGSRRARQFETTAGSAE